MRIIIYLAHPLTEIKWGKQMQEKLENREYIVLNPFEGRKDTRGYGDFTREEAINIVQSDLDKIEDADVVVAYFPYPTTGTAMEVFFACAVCNKPVFSLAKGVWKRHVWIQTYSYVVENEEQLFRELERWRKKWK